MPRHNFAPTDIHGQRAFVSGVPNHVERAISPWSFTHLGENASIGHELANGWRRLLLLPTAPQCRFVAAGYHLKRRPSARLIKVVLVMVLPQSSSRAPLVCRCPILSFL